MNKSTLGVRSWIRDRFGSALILISFSAFLLFWFGPSSSASSILSVDLPGHTALIERLSRMLLSGHLFFYDRWWFSGWPAFEFYGFLPHLVTALLSIVLQVFTREPAYLATQLLMLLGCALLPLSLFYAAAPLVKEVVQDKEPRYLEYRRLLALFCCVFAFWFLNQPLDWYGIGARSLFRTGLFTQLFGWHLGLIYLGCVARYARIGGTTARNTLALSIAAILLTHELSAFYFLSVGALAIIIVPGRRAPLFLVHLWGVLLSAFALLPHFWFSSAMTPLYVYPPEGDFLTIFLRYPLGEMIYVFMSWVRGGIFIPIDLTFVTVFFSLVGLLVSPSVRHSRVLTAFSLAALLSAILFSSSFVSASIPLGIHYYRFHAYLFLLLSLLCAVVPLAVLRDIERYKPNSSLYRLSRMFFLAIALLCIVSSAAVSSLEGRAVAARDERRAYTEHMRVLTALGSEESRGRVLFEFSRDRGQFGFLSPHFLSAKLARVTGRETLNGLFIQSSLTQQFVGWSLKQLGAEAYRTPPLLEEAQSRDGYLALQQLKDLGVETLVLNSSDAVRTLSELTGALPTVSGVFRLFSLGQGFSAIAPLKKNLALVFDPDGIFSFQLIQFLTYTDPSLYRDWEIGYIKDISQIPTETRVLITARIIEGVQIPQIVFEPPKALPRSPSELNATPYSSMAIATRFQKRWLDQVKRELVQIAARPPQRTDVSDQQPTLTFGKSAQEILLTGLTPGSLVRINYSFSPFWSSEEGTIIRGLAERMYFLPKSDVALLTYTRYASLPVICGAFLSLASFILLFLPGLRRAKKISVEGQPRTLGSENAPEENEPA